MAVFDNKYKILCFLDYDKGRDVEILMPVIYYAETYLHAQVEFAFLRDIHKIFLLKPDLVLLANAIGSKYHFYISKYASENHIPVFALISEGNFRTDGTFNYWGANTDKKIYQDTICLWSKRTFEFLSKEIPDEKDKMAVVGATGFDRYKVYKFISKPDYLKKINYSKYKKVIVYAGWAFGKMFNKDGIKEIRNAHKDNAEERLKWMAEQMPLVENILRKAAEHNPDILFILKRHPNEIHPHIKQADKNEMVNLKNYPNVMYTIDANIDDLISIADIFTGFETTTATESWVQGNTPTILLNPDEHFKRDKLHKGSVIVHSFEEFQKLIDEFYTTGQIKAFSNRNLEKIRKRLIKETIGFSDGMNHIRTGFYLQKSLEKTKPNPNKKVKVNISHFSWYYLVRIGRCFYKESIFLKLPKLKKTIWVFNNLALKHLPILKERYFRYLDDFHKKNNIAEKIKDSDFWNTINQTNE